EALTQRGKIAFQAGEGAKAEGFLRRAVEAEPFNRQSNHTLYLCLNQQGKEKEAQELLPKLQRIEADIERLMEISNKEMDPRPNDPQLTYEIGAILLRNGQTQFGLYWLERALQLNPSHEPTLRTLMDYYQGIGKKSMA